MLTLNDGRNELWQWDTGRKLTVDTDCSQVHFSNNVFGRSIDVDVVDGVAVIPDVLLQADNDLTAWAFVGTPENGYTKTSKVFKVNRKNKPADYVFTPPEQTSLEEIKEKIEHLESIQDPDAIKNAVDDYLANNPIKVEEKDPTVPEWAKQPTPPDVKIPDKLPNPNVLTFTGAVSGTYDGSAPVTLNIPDSGGNVDLTGVVKSVNGVTPDENGNVQISVSGGGNTTQKEEVTTVSVGAESVVLDATAPEQTVNLSWAVDNVRTIPAFTNYYIAKSGISYPRTFNTDGYVQFWDSKNYHGNAEAFVEGHKYFHAMHYTMDGDSAAKLGGFGTAVTPTNSWDISGSGWAYGLNTPTNVWQIAFSINKTSTGTGTIEYVYCIDITAMQEAGLVAEDVTINDLVELFGGLPLVPGQNYEGGSVGTGTATLSINRNGETRTVDNASSTATVKGGDVLSVEGGSVTFFLKVMREVSADNPASVWAGKKWVAFGDSLTDESINADKKYYRYIEEMTGITVVVMGRGGTGYYRTYDSGTAYGQRMAQVPADADIITIFGSVNDWHTKSANVAMGNASDTMDAGTLAGYINECIDVAIEKAPYAQIALVTPMDYYGLPDATLEGIANIIKDVAKYRKIKCLDMYHESGFRVRNPVFAQQFITDYSETGDSYGHPNNLAHEKLIAPEFMELLKRMLLTA